jgi:hypothetical protein
MPFELDQAALMAAQSELYQEQPDRAPFPFSRIKERAELRRAQAENERLRALLKRTSIYLTLHEQEHPEWNGNRFDDKAAIEAALGEDR